MLGWFKKKFAKKADDAPAEQPADAGLLTTEEDVLQTEPPETPEPVQPAPPEVEPAAAEPLPEPRAREVAEEPEPPAMPEKKAQKTDEAPVSFFKRLAEKLSKTREAFTYQLDSLFLGRKVIDAELFDDLEELLITADLGAATTREVLDHARRRVSRKELSDPESLKVALKEKIKSFITDSQRDAELVMPESGPFVIMVIGVNGVGKTTTIGKIANKFVKAGSSVMLVAGDTFRAAAVSQLQIWGERTGVHVVARADGADPSSVVYDAMDIARAKNYDVVLVDTAGRLHTQTNLMEELKKIKRVMGKRLEGAPHEVMLVIDATTGQNGISQAKLFHEAVGITGITLTKLDGTAKGGIVANICREMQTPIRFIGVGEKMEDLRDFDPDEFIEALFEARLP
jgi:fused signal recognition particle receptor